YRIPIIHIISNNNMYGTIWAHQEKKYPNRVIATNLSNPNFAELAKNFGGQGERIHNNEEFSDALNRAIESGKPSILEVMTNPAILSAKEEEKLRLENKL